jgi:sugar (pentulose or hexulose) kinase
VKPYILSHDLGTTGDKAALFSGDGRLVAAGFSAYPTFYPERGWAEQDPEGYWDAFCASTRSLIERAGIRPAEIAVVAFSGQMMAALPVDREGQALRRSIIWADLRSTRQAEELSRRIGADRVYELTGHRLSASYSAAKIMWIREHEPEVYRRASKFLQAKDFIVLRLTGRAVTDYSDGSGMNLLDLKSLEWSEEMLEAAEIERSRLPDLLESTETAGKVSAEAARASGLAEGTPVVIGGGDGPCATCGADGLLFLPYLMGERSPLWDPEARGCFIGLAVRHTKDHLIRAVLEGVAFNIRLIQEAFAEQGVRGEAVRMIGGGARSRLWRKIFADVLERPVQRLNFIDEATSVGAAIAGGVGIGLIPSLQEAGRFVTVEEEVAPDPACSAACRKSYEAFRASYAGLREVFHILARC